MKKLIASLLILVLLIGVLASCGGDGGSGSGDGGDGGGSGNSGIPTITEEDKIRATVTGFTAAYNDGNWDEMMKYLDPITRSILEGVIDIAGDFVDIDLRDVFTIGVNVLGAGFGDLTFVEIKRTSDTDATVTVEMTSPDYPPTLIYFIMVQQKGSWLIRDMTNVKPADELDPDGKPIIKDPCPSDFIDGLTIVRSGELFSTYWAVINTKGETVYETAYGTEDGLFDHTWTNMGGGAGFSVKKYHDNTVVEEIINANGEVVFSSNGDDYDFITAYGGGYVVVYKNVSTITTSAHTYGIIDAKGQWKMPMTEIYYQGGIEYVGEGMFHLPGKAFINAETGEIISTTISVYDRTFQNGAMRIYGNDGEDTILSDSGEWVSLPRNYVLYTDGSYTALANCLEEYAYYTNDDTVVIERDGRYYTVNVLDFTDEGEILKSNMLEEFTSEHARGFEFFGKDYAVLEIYGADQNKYVTLVDKEANILFDPVCIGDYDVSVEYSDGVIICSGYRKIFALNESGEIIISEDAGFISICAFDNGIALAITNDGKNVFINKTGEIIIGTFYKK